MRACTRRRAENGGCGGFNRPIELDLGGGRKAGVCGCGSHVPGRPPASDHFICQHSTFGSLRAPPCRTPSPRAPRRATCQLSRATFGGVAPFVVARICMHPSRSELLPNTKGKYLHSGTVFLEDVALTLYALCRRGILYTTSGALKISNIQAGIQQFIPRAFAL